MPTQRIGFREFPDSANSKLPAAGAIANLLIIKDRPEIFLELEMDPGMTGRIII